VPSAPTTAGPSTEPAARTWSELAKQVAETSPDDLELRSADTSARASSVLRCFKLEEENYCLGLGFVDQVPTGAQMQELLAPPSQRADGEVGVEQDIPTGALTPEVFVAERAAMPKSARVNAELDEMQAAWAGRDKARALRLLDSSPNGEERTEAEEPAAHQKQPGGETQPGAGAEEQTGGETKPGVREEEQPGGQRGETQPGSGAGDQTGGRGVTPTPMLSSSTPPRPTPTPTRSAPTRGTPTPVKLPTSSYIMKGFQTSQEKGYWCGPAAFQSIDWADDNQRDTQASWAKDLGTTTSGTAITAMVKQTNLKTNWDLAAGTYIVQSVAHWNAQKFFTVHQNHLGDGQPAPIIEHTQLKRYFPYLAFNHSGHYQVGRGYDRAKGTIAIFEVFNERRFNSRGNVTHGPKNIPATALFNATLANSFKNIGL
jgi:hypothetical protein